MNVERKGDRVYLSGVINENSDFAPLLSEAAPLKIDFSGVQRINSIGVRSWMRFLSQWGDKPLEYWECSAVIVDQLSIIGSLCGIRSRIAAVKSLFLPTECQACGREAEVRVTHDDFLKDPTLESLLKPCAHCAGALNYVVTDFKSLFE